MYSTIIISDSPYVTNIHDQGTIITEVRNAEGCKYTHLHRLHIPRRRIDLHTYVPHSIRIIFALYGKCATGECFCGGWIASSFSLAPFICSSLPHLCKRDLHVMLIFLWLHSPTILQLHMISTYVWLVN